MPKLLSLSENILKDAQKGLNITELAQKYAISTFSVSAALEKAGFDRREVVYKENKQQLDILEQKLAEGKTAFAIGREMAIDHRRIHTLMTYLGHGQASIFIQPRSAQRKSRKNAS